MSACARCRGLLAVQYDAESRTRVIYCLNCGARPLQVTYRVDGFPIGSPLRCKECGVRPRVVLTQTHRRGEEELARCEPCRRTYNAARYAFMKRGRVGQ